MDKWFIKEVIPEEIGRRLREAGQRREANKGIILAKALGSIGASCVPQTNSRVLSVRIVATWGKGAGLSHPFDLKTMVVGNKSMHREGHTDIIEEIWRDLEGALLSQKCDDQQIQS